MSDLVGSGPPAGLAVMRELQQRVAALEHDNAHLIETIAILRRLVGDAFQEGFEARVPGVEEPWLIDWLQSKSKARVAELFEGPTRHEEHGEHS